MRLALRRLLHYLDQMSDLLFVLDTSESFLLVIECRTF